jgi:hypothetical protein
MKRVHPFEEALYERIASEISPGQIKPGLWLKATVDSGGNEHKAKSLYTRFRYAQLVDEIAHDQELERQQRVNAVEQQRRTEFGPLVEKLRAQHFAIEEKEDGAFVLFEPSGDCRRFASYAEFAAYAATILRA